REALRLDLETFDRTVHVTHGAAATRFLAEDVPWFERRTKFELKIALRKVADDRETKFEVRREPVKLERIFRIAQIADDVLQIRFAEMRQHPAVMNIRAPAHEAVL